MISFACLPLALPLLLSADAGNGATAAVGLQREVIFESYTPQSSSAELLRRVLSPLTAQRAQHAVAASGEALREQAIDLTREKFALYVPAQKPASGYAVLVFIPPWEEAKVPPEWISVLDRHGMIFVSAANSGNSANVLDRREPLALLAAHNVLKRYRIDPSRVYVGGFSGGSRVALRLALAYPDVFRGALLNAGSGLIGNAQIPLPPAPLFRQFQDSSRLVYVTGKQDRELLDLDTRSRSSMQSWCMFDVATQAMPWSGHELAEPGAFDRALTALAEPAKNDADKLAACRARIDEEVAAQIHAVEKLIDDGRKEPARAALNALDVHYGGLAAPRSIELSERIDAR